MPAPRLPRIGGMVHMAQTAFKDAAQGFI
ncbi:MAG: hypothetical protein RL758_2351, partial [Pseudomonadota bacterium]